MTKEDLLKLDQAIIVTGASQGIGEAIARLFARQGASVVLAARRGDLLERIAREIRQEGGAAEAKAADVTDESDVHDMAQTCLERFGRIDGLVNSAGVSPLSPITETSLEVWEKTMAVNATGVFLCCRAVWQAMRDNGQGSILNIASGAAKKAHGDWVAYCASKWAVMGLTESLALEGFPFGIRVNALCPGPTATPMRFENFPDEDRDRLLEPGEVAEAALFFFTQASKHVRNAALDVRKRPRGCNPIQ